MISTANTVPYGAEISYKEKAGFVNDLGLSRQCYFLLMARMEPENKVELILDGFRNSRTDKKFVVVGDTKSKFGTCLVNEFRCDSRSQFTGSIFNKEKVQHLVSHSAIYFHGHSVGGTNPYLLEAMASKAFFAAHDNPYNKAVLNGVAYYFSNAEDVRILIDSQYEREAKIRTIRQNFHKIENNFNWQTVVNEYEQFMLSCLLKLKPEKDVCRRRYANQ